MKIYMLCEISTGYLYNFIIYTGADSIYEFPTAPLHKPFDDYVNPSKVVPFLMKGLYGKGYNIVVIKVVSMLSTKHTSVFVDIGKKRRYR